LTLQEVVAQMLEEDDINVFILLQMTMAISVMKS